MSEYIRGYGPNEARIAFVTDNPLPEDVANKRLLSGQVGRFFDNMLKDAGISRDSVWLTSVSKYEVMPKPKGSKMPWTVRARNSGIDIDQCYSELRTELYQVKPNIICALGSTALSALNGKTPLAKHRGSMMLGCGMKMIPTYNPYDIIYQTGDSSGYWTKAIATLDLRKVLAQSYDPNLELPSRTLHVARNSSDVYQFFNDNRHRTRPAIDIEAYKCIPICIGISFSPSEGLTIPLWNTYGISGIADSDMVSIWSLLADFLANQDVVGQNFGYDRDKIKRLGFIARSLASDTMLKAFCIHPELPKNLAFLTSIYTNEPYYKDEGMYEGSTNDLLIGCARDACVTKEVDLAQDKDIDELGNREYYEKFILPLHNIYSGIENEGFRVDEGLRKQIITKYIEWDERIRYQLYQLAGDYINCSSPKQVASLLYDNWKIPVRDGTGEDVLTQILNSSKLDEAKRKGIELILEDRRVKKTLSSYLYAPADFDGRMRTSYFLCLKTGRSSTQQQEPPIRPVVEQYDENGKKVKKAIGLAFQTMTKHGDIGPEVRTMFIPDEGEIFLQADSAQAEARVIFLLAEDYEALELIDTHDYHALTASWFVGGTEDSWSKRVLGYEHPNRFLGKTLRHAGHLGASKRRAAIETNTQARKYKIPITISEGLADKALKIFHAKQPKIRGVFQAGVRAALENNRKLAAPVPYGIDSKVGGVRTFFERWNEDLMREAFSYIPQRAVSENTKGAALRIKGVPEKGIVGRAPWIRILVEAHDALLVSVPIARKQEAALILKEELERPIDFSTCTLKRDKLIIPCEVEEGYNYKDLHKFKWMVA